MGWVIIRWTFEVAIFADLQRRASPTSVLQHAVW